VKRHIKDWNTAQLTALLKDLYDSCADNRTFLDARVQADCHKVRHQCTCTLIGNVKKVRPCRPFEQLPGKVLPTPRLCGEVPGPYRQHPVEAAGLADRF
jgi:hypothetical protein